MFRRDMCVAEHTFQAASVWVYAKDIPLVRATDCKPFVENPQRGFSTVSEAEHWPSLCLFIWSYSWVYR